MVSHFPFNCPLTSWSLLILATASQGNRQPEAATRAADNGFADYRGRRRQFRGESKSPLALRPARGAATPASGSLHRCGEPGQARAQPVPK